MYYVPIRFSPTFWLDKANLKPCILFFIYKHIKIPEIPIPNQNVKYKRTKNRIDTMFDTFGLYFSYLNVFNFRGPNNSRGS